ncbi:MAG: hypothetical protein Kow00121_39830 [Elainellaceae cyanobacterium]
MHRQYQIKQGNMVTYLIGATFTFGTLFTIFMKDSSTSKTDITSWAVLIVATLFWFFTLPFVIQKQVQRMRTSAVPAIAHQKPVIPS